MDRLTPLELERMQLPTAFRGFDRRAVQVALARASKELEWLLGELKDAKREGARLYEELEVHRSQERNLQDTLKLATRAAEDIRAAAHTEASSIVEAARREAEEIREQARVNAKDLRWEIERLRMERDEFLEGFRALLEQHLRRLEGNDRQPVLVNLETRVPRTAP